MDLAPPFSYLIGRRWMKPAAETSLPPLRHVPVLNRLCPCVWLTTARVKRQWLIFKPIHDQAASTGLIQPPETWIPGLNSRVQPDGWLWSRILTGLINLSWQTFFSFIYFFSFPFKQYRSTHTLDIHKIGVEGCLMTTHDEQMSHFDNIVQICLQRVLTVPVDTDSYFSSCSPRGDQNCVRI